MSKEQLLFCPLGGSGEIGMNLNLYAYGKEDNEKWIVLIWVLLLLMTLYQV